MVRTALQGIGKKVGGTSQFVDVLQQLRVGWAAHDSVADALEDDEPLIIEIRCSEMTDWGLGPASSAESRVRCVGHGPVEDRRECRPVERTTCNPFAPGVGGSLVDGQAAPLCRRAGRAGDGSVGVPAPETIVAPAGIPGPAMWPRRRSRCSGSRR